MGLAAQSSGRGITSLYTCLRLRLLSHRPMSMLKNALPAHGVNKRRSTVWAYPACPQITEADLPGENSQHRTASVNVCVKRSAQNRARQCLCENSSTEPRASASGHTTRPTGTGASVPRRSRNPLLSTQAQSPRGQSAPVPRRSTVDSLLCPGVFTRTRERANAKRSSVTTSVKVNSLDGF
jgi:hypothetical protein